MGHPSHPDEPMHPHPFAAMLPRVTLAALTLAVLPAHAVPVFELTGRSAEMSMLNLYAGIGLATAQIEGNATDSTATLPARLDLVGSGQDAEAVLFNTASLSASWALWQDYGVAQAGADTVLSAAGAMALSASAGGCNAEACTPLAVFYDSSNFQTLRFSLSEATAFQAHGGSAREQSVNIAYSADGGQTWGTYAGWSSFTTYGGSILNGPQEVKDWSQAGTFLAGMYQVSNGPNRYGSALDPWFSWDYEITLLGTQLAPPVPEPGSLLLMAGGLAALLMRRNRRAD